MRDVSGFVDQYSGGSLKAILYCHFQTLHELLMHYCPRQEIKLETRLDDDEPYEWGEAEVYDACWSPKILVFQMVPAQIPTKPTDVERSSTANTLTVAPTETRKGSVSVQSIGDRVTAVYTAAIDSTNVDELAECVGEFLIHFSFARPCRLVE